MCGFVGLFGNINVLEKDLIRSLKNSLKLIHHRGPNSTKTLQLKNFSVGFKRLAIQDLSHRANQPMVSHDKRFTILFNGNIHNFKKIKENLIKKKDVKFNSTSDTEVLIQLFLIKKHKMLKYLEGHFSIIIHDKKKNEIFISNDRFGQKPLYYIIHKNIFFFASEIKAFLPIVKKFNIPWKINKNLINEYLTYRCNLGQNTLIECVKKFKNGNYAYFNLKNGLRNYRYFNLNLNSFNNNKKKITFKRKKVYIEKFKELLNNSVKDQLISDVPVGLTLSGGLDSSLILKFISKNTQSPVECYHVKFDKIKKDKFTDESDFARKIAKKYGCKLNIINYNYKDYLRDFKKSIWFNDHPQSIPHMPALYRLFQIASKKVSVMLSGEGADEIFAGYDDFLKNEKNPCSINLYSNQRDIKKF